MGINLAVPWNQQMSQGKRYLSKNLRRWEICLAFIEKAIIQMSKIIFYLQFQNMDLLLKTNAFSLMKYTNKLRPRYVQYWFLFCSSTWQCLWMTLTLRCLSSSCSTCLYVLTPIVLPLTGNRGELYSPISSSRATTVE